MLKHNQWRLVLSFVIVLWAVFMLQPLENQPFVPFAKAEAKARPAEFAKLMDEAAAVKASGAAQSEYVALRQIAKERKIDLAQFFPQIYANGSAGNTGTRWFPDKNVGCGGFTLRSRRFLEVVSTRPGIIAATSTAVDDEPICRALRPQLEALGLKWAPEDLALDFSFERVRRSATSRHFGYHGTFNWPFVLDADDLAQRIGMTMKIPYIAERGMLHELFKLLAFLYDPARTTEFRWISPPAFGQ